MENIKIKLMNTKKKNNRINSADFTSPDVDSDKSGADNDADKTVKKNKSWKSKLGENPDSTGIDTKADKTKKEKFSNKQNEKVNRGKLLI